MKAELVICEFDYPGTNTRCHRSKYVVPGEVAECIYEVEMKDGERYYMKTVNHGPMVPVGIYELEVEE